MPNVHKPDREPVSFVVPRHLMLRVKRESRRLGQTLTEFCNTALYDRVQHVALTSEDYMEIARATAKAEKTRRRIATKLGEDTPPKRPQKDNGDEEPKKNNGDE